MPELPDVVVYIEALSRRILGVRLEAIRLASPFLLRSVDPPIAAMAGRIVTGLSRLGKRIVVELQDDYFLVLHLMIAGRLRWKDAGHAIPRKVGLAAFDFTNGTVLLTEAGGKKRASLYAVRGRSALAGHDRGGMQVLGSPVADFKRAITQENHTLKRTLTDPRILSGIGNAYSDEILHAARLSPLQLSRNLSDEEVERLHSRTIETLTQWIERTRTEVGDGFPDKVTAFRPGMAVHGRYRQPCPVCESPVQRIVYAKNEINYCATCQTEGRLLADRAFSRLLKSDWPKTLEEWELGMAERKAARGESV